MRLEHRIAIITGGAKGMGGAITRTLGREGPWDDVPLDRRRQQQLKQHGRRRRQLEQRRQRCAGRHSLRLRPRLPLLLPRLSSLEDDPLILDPLSPYCAARSGVGQGRVAGDDCGGLLASRLGGLGAAPQGRFLLFFKIIFESIFNNFLF